jgi:hypothetical protein
VNRSYPEGNRLLLCISTGRTTLADSIKPFETAQGKPVKAGQTERPHRGEPADQANRGKNFRASAMLQTTPLACERMQPESEEARPVIRANAPVKPVADPDQKWSRREAEIAAVS